MKGDYTITVSVFVVCICMLIHAGRVNRAMELMDGQVRDLKVRVDTLESVHGVKR